ncbi:MAG: ABC transporter permease [Egibacteraceae bacterium]
MAVDTTDTQGVPDQGETDTTAATVHLRHTTEGLSIARKVLRYGAMPLFLLVVLTGLYLWVQSLQLDSIEQRQLNASFIIGKLREHVRASTLSTALVILLAVPMGILATRPTLKRFAPALIGFGNFGQAIPSLGLLTLIFLLARAGIVPGLPSTGLIPVVVALTAYSILPILRNTMVGLQQVDDSLLEAGRGMGLSNTGVLRRIEMPLAVPVILAGVRTALIINVGTAALVFLYGGGGLGELIFQGFQLRRLPILMTGAVLTAALALLVDYLAGLVEEFLTPRGL